VGAGGEGDQFYRAVVFTAFSTAPGSVHEIGGLANEREGLKMALAQVPSDVPPSAATVSAEDDL
jgi:hypothetical protein